MTHSRDEYCVDLVQKYLGENGKSSIILYTDEYPVSFQTYSSPASDGEGILYHGTHFPISKISGIWIRKWAGAGTFKEQMDSPREMSIYHESSTALEQWFNNLPSHIFQMDALHRVKRAEDKLFQLKTAHKVGLSIPETLITNHPVLINSFLESGNRSVKMHTTLSWGMGGDEDFFYTQRIESENIPNLNGIEKAPLIYQEYIHKKREFRVAYVDTKFFCGIIPSHISETQTDWRTPGTEFEWTAGQLPQDIEHKLITLMNSLSLKYGIMDLLEDQNGNFHFLEVNPVGEWGMLEKFANLPISKAIAETLIKYSSS